METKKTHSRSVGRLNNFESLEISASLPLVPGHERWAFLEFHQGDLR